MTSGDALTGNPRALSTRVAAALGGRAAELDGIAAFVSSDCDGFLNQVFVRAGAREADAVVQLEGRPAFVWLPDEPDPLTRSSFADVGFAFAQVHGMAIDLDGPLEAARADVEPVRSEQDLAAWHELYCDGLGVDRRSADDWGRLVRALGPDGDGSFVLFLASVEGVPAGAGSVFVHGAEAGLYCFATRSDMRGRGLATAIIAACHAYARDRGGARAVLQATDAGRPVYARAGYEYVRPLPLFVRK